MTFSAWTDIQRTITQYLTIIPGARMGSESIAHEAEGRMGAIDSEAMRAGGIIVLVKSN